MTDPRVTPQPNHLAWVDGSVSTPTAQQVCVPFTDILRTPGGPRDRQMVYGEVFHSFGQNDGWAYGMTEASQYVGFVQSSHLGPVQTTDLQVITQWATAYDVPDFKTPDRLTLPYGARLAKVADAGSYWETPVGFIPKQQLAQDKHTDPADVALTFLNSPYVWGGNTPAGIDCSGLVQAAYTACGLPCPGDSDLMEVQLPGHTPTQPARNQLYFWKGHVAITLNETHLVHANAHAMAVAIEPIEDAIPRIQAAGDGPVTRRLQIPV